MTGGGDDTVQGQNHDDILFGEGGSDFLQGGAGHDKLDGGAGFDELSGGSGDDRLYFSGEDIYDGGADFDTFDANGMGYILAGWPVSANVTYGDATQGLRIDTEHGVAEVRGTAAATENFYISGALGIGLGDAEFVSIERYRLTDFGDYIAGSDDAEEIHGYGGDAIIVLGRDITERKQLQQRLAQADRMASVGTRRLNCVLS